MLLIQIRVLFRYPWVIQPRSILKWSASPLWRAQEDSWPSALSPHCGSRGPYHKVCVLGSHQPVELQPDRSLTERTS